MSKLVRPSPRLLSLRYSWRNVPDFLAERSRDWLRFSSKREEHDHEYLPRHHVQDFQVRNARDDCDV
jgi:hypothetical protein